MFLSSEKRDTSGLVTEKCAYFICFFAFWIVKSDNNNDGQQPSAEPTQGEAEVGVSSPDPPTVGCPAGFLTRLLSLAGHVAFRQLVYLDCDLFGELKRRHAIQEEKKERKTGRKSPAGAVLETPATCNRSKVRNRMVHSSSLF